MTKQINMNFKKLRELSKISQETMAQYLNMDQSNIAKFESGERSLKMLDLEKACYLLGCRIDDLLHEDVKPVIVASFRKEKLNAQTLSDIAIIHKLALNIVEMEELLTNEE